MSLRALVFTAMAFACVPAFAAAPVKKVMAPEAQAVAMFHKTCVLSQGDTAMIETNLSSFLAAGQASKIDPKDFTKRTGLKADHVWVVQPIDTKQKMLITTLPGVCALHLADGKASALQNDFLAAAKLLAQAAKAQLAEHKEIEKGGSEVHGYSVLLPNAKTTPVLTLTTSDKQSKSGTRHFMTFTVIKK